MCGNLEVYTSVLFGALSFFYEESLPLQTEGERDRSPASLFSFDMAPRYRRLFGETMLILDSRRIFTCSLPVELVNEADGLVDLMKYNIEPLIRGMESLAATLPSHASRRDLVRSANGMQDEGGRYFKYALDQTFRDFVDARAKIRTDLDAMQAKHRWLSNLVIHSGWVRWN